MPVTYRIDAEHRLVEILNSGVVTIEDMKEIAEKLLQDPAFNAEFRSLIVFERVEITPSSLELMKHGDWRKLRPKVPQMAFVATTDYEYGMARMYEMATRGVAAKEVRIFRRLKEAREWLGLPG